MKISKKKKNVTAASKIYADDMQDFGLADQIDDISDSVGDIQDTIEDMDEDEVDIEVDNNVANHFLAECDRCHGLFISALVESDQKVEKISGVCPLCDKETDQYLKWIIKDVEY